MDAGQGRTDLPAEPVEETLAPSVHRMDYSTLSLHLRRACVTRRRLPPSPSSSDPASTRSPCAHRFCSGTTDSTPRCGARHEPLRLPRRGGGPPWVGALFVGSRTSAWTEARTKPRPSSTSHEAVPDRCAEWLTDGCWTQSSACDSPHALPIRDHISFAR